MGFILDRVGIQLPEKVIPEGIPVRACSVSITKSFRLPDRNDSVEVSVQMNLFRPVIPEEQDEI